MEKQITAHVLRYLLEHRFESKAEMARQLDIQQRTFEKVFENLDVAKGGTIALDKALSYCARCHVSLDSILESVACASQGSDVQTSYSVSACNRLMVVKPKGLTKEGEQAFESMVRFLRQASARVCPACHMWCNPWDGKHPAEERDCYIGHMAQEIRRDVLEFYAQEAGNS